MALLDNKVAIVSGAGAGLGRSYALAMASEGARLVVNDFQQEAAEETVKLIIEQGGVAIANVGDVGTLEGGETLLRSALEGFGRVDILVNNAGILRDASFAKMEEAQWDAVMHVHVKALYYVTRPVFAWMKDNGGGGVIVNTTSTAGIRGNFGQTNYGTAKCGVIGFSTSLAIEGRKYGIRVWNIGPAAATAMTAHMPEEYQRQFHIDRVAPTLLYMVSELSGDQTGKTLLAGGGWIGEARFEVSDGYVPSENITPQEIAQAVEDGKVMLPQRPDKWVTAYGPQSGE